jgi:hypothetical protein
VEGTLDFRALPNDHVVFNGGSNNNAFFCQSKNRCEEAYNEEDEIKQMHELFDHQAIPPMIRSILCPIFDKTLLLDR